MRLPLLCTAIPFPWVRVQVHMHDSRNGISRGPGRRSSLCTDRSTTARTVSRWGSESDGVLNSEHSRLHLCKRSERRKRAPKWCARLAPLETDS